MFSLVKTKANNLLDSLAKTAELAALYGTDETKNMDIYSNQIELIYTTMCKADRARRAIESCKDVGSMEEFEAQYSQNIQVKLPNVKKSKEYKSSMTRIKQLLEENVMARPGTSTHVQDDMVMELEVSDKDPITKRPMENPVRNKLCKHHYERSTILSSIQVNPRLRCPIAGCGNKTFIRQEHLEDDHDFAQMLRRRREREDAEMSQSP